jgi:hypothetical protein
LREDSETVDALADPVRRGVGREYPGLLYEFPLSLAVDSFSTLRAYAEYGRVPRGLWNSLNQLRVRYGEGSLAWYNKALLRFFVENFAATKSLDRYPRSINAIYAKHMERIAREFSALPDEYYRWDNDLFRKDLAVARQKLVPCGAQLIDVRSGIGRRDMLRGGLRHATRFLVFVRRTLGGRFPLYQMHMDNRLVLEFNPRGWASCYRRVAEMIERDGEVLGLSGASWWFDPALRKISPRLAYLHDIPTQNGAQAFDLGEDEQSTQLAITNSKERRTALEQGHYRPRKFIVIWPRSALLAWAKKVGQ